jgi:hypothetical protein
MRVLVAICHVYNPRGDPQYASSRPDPGPRIEAVTACLRGLSQNLSATSLYSDMAARTVAAYPLTAPVELDIGMCTTGTLHLMDELPLEGLTVRHHNTSAEPLLTGFECQAVLRDALGSYDWYGYLEDDVVVEDPLFLDKLAWFQEQAGAAAVLQPNRFELSETGRPTKLYIDGPITHDQVSHYQELRDQPELTFWAMARQIRFVRPLNPFAASYFLTAEQMDSWARQPYFLDRDTSFVGPLESMSALGVMKTFRIYKPAPENATFLEVHHHDDHWSKLARDTFAWPEPTQADTDPSTGAG